MVTVYKIGGNVIEDQEMLERFCRRFARVKGPKILIHGGGVLASELQKSLGQTPVKIEGRRVTDADALKAVTMCYAGWCNKTLVAMLQKCKCNAIGLAGCDGNVIRAKKRAPRTLEDGVTVVDYGFVGDVTAASVNRRALSKLLKAGMVPVICAINHDGSGQLLNTNADTVAGSVAAAMKGLLVCCFEQPGVLMDRNDPGSVIPRIVPGQFEQYKKDGTVSEGMIPKIENCMKAARESGTGYAVIKSADDVCKASAGTVVEC